MFINTVRQRRQELGLSQTRLACMMGIAESTLSAVVELGKRQPWPKIRKSLSRALGKTEAELFAEG